MHKQESAPALLGPYSRWFAQHPLRELAHTGILQDARGTPSSQPCRFAANGAWLAVQVMARWTARLGLGEQVVTTKTLRRHFFSIAGRLTRSARRLTLHLPQRWPWKNQFSAPWHDCEPGHSQPDGDPSAADPPSGPLTSPPTRAKSVPEGRLWPAPYRIPPAMATAGRHHRACAAASRRPHHHLLESGLARSPSPTHQPLCQRQRQSLRWIRG